MHAGAEVIVRWLMGEERGNALGLHTPPIHRYSGTVMEKKVRPDFS